MVETRDLLITLGTLTILTATTIGFLNVSLPGTTTEDLANVACKVPVLEGQLQQCNEIQEGETSFRVDTQITVSRTTIEQVQYKTVEQSGNVYSSTGPGSLAFPAETRDAKLNIVLKNPDGEIIASETKRFGTMVGTETETTTFSSNVPREGDYRLEMAWTGEGCGLLICAPISIEERVTLGVPNLPLNEYDTVAVN